MLKFLRFAAAMSLQVAFTCGGVGCSASSSGRLELMESDEPSPPASDAGDERPKPDSGRPSLVQALTYDDVRPIFTTKCNGESCHSSTEISRPALAASERSLAYQEAVEVARRLVEVVLSGEMPFGRRCASDGAFVSPEPEGCLTPEEREVLVNWVAQGTPE